MILCLTIAVDGRYSDFVPVSGTVFPRKLILLSDLISAAPFSVGLTASGNVADSHCVPILAHAPPPNLYQAHVCRREPSSLIKFAALSAPLFPKQIGLVSRKTGARFQFASAKLLLFSETTKKKHFFKPKKRKTRSISTYSPIVSM